MLKVVRWASRHKWRLFAASVVGGTAYAAWKILRHIPLREILAIARERAQEEIDATIRGGDGSRIVMVCIEEVRNDLAKLQDVSEKQAALRELAGKPQESRLIAFQGLSITSFTRTFCSVYSLCIVQLFVNAQVFELIRHQRQGRGLFEEAQRRFLSVVRDFGGRQDGSELRWLVNKVEGVVKTFFAQHDYREQCDKQWVAQAISHIRDGVEGARRQGGERPLQCEMTRSLVKLLKGRLPSNEAQRQSDVQLGMRGSLDAGIQERMLVSRMLEVVQSELYAEAFSALVDRSFSLLHNEIVQRAFATTPHSGSVAEQEGSGGASSEHRTHGGAEGVEVAAAGTCNDAGSKYETAARMPFIKLVPIISNVFNTVMGQGLAPPGPFHAQTAEVEACRNLFEAISVGAS